MKNVILSVAFLLFGLPVFSQTPLAPQSEAQQLTEKLAAKYNLTEDQKADMLVVQQRNFRNLAEIEDLKNTNPMLYVRKLKALAYAYDGTMRRLLDREQRAIYFNEKTALRKQKAKASKDLKDSGASDLQIELKLTELERENLTKE
ncbi:MAG TPA: hypothetical protein ENJ95_09865 [Bacteroidetes bacterium]|nr:hypothetical protein [Bacteroidota bacterium]